MPAAAFSSTLKVETETIGGFKLLEATTCRQTVVLDAWSPLRLVRPPASVTSSDWQNTAPSVSSTELPLVLET